MKRLSLLMALVCLAVVVTAAAQTGDSKKPKGTATANDSRAELDVLIDKLGKTPPDWFQATKLNHPFTLDLTFPEKAEGGWNNQKNVGQFLWDIIYPNPGRRLKWFGPTWLSAPLRRVVQGVCLVAFLVFFFYVCWPYTARPVEGSTDWPSHYADDLASKEKLAAELFLIIDPLVSFSTGLAARSWVWSLTSAAIILLVCVFIPREFCGYLCPLGTVIDLFDWAVGKRVTRFRVADDGWWVHLKYYVLLAILVAAACGVLISGVFAAIPVITRGLLFTLAPLQTGVLRGWHLVPPLNVGHFVSLALFAEVLGLGFLKPRF